jgi:hypothetical protein
MENDVLCRKTLEAKLSVFVGVDIFIVLALSCKSRHLEMTLSQDPIG